VSPGFDAMVDDPRGTETKMLKASLGRRMGRAVAFTAD